MRREYFLGANSKDGFFSLYGGFCRAPGDYLTVIKGGPGTGKSGFMRKLGQRAETRGMDVEYVLCSGDPDSLDGVYIPALRRGWVDGTSPHIADPARFVVNGDYVNLGVFFSGRYGEEERAAINALYDAYKADYATAYSYLSAAAALKRAYLPPLFVGEKRELIQRRVRNILRRCRNSSADNGGARRERFLHAISCKGELWLKDQLEQSVPLVYEFDDGFGGADTALGFAAHEAEILGASAILCRDPLDCARLDALILPEWGVAFASADYALPSARHIRLDAAIEPAALQPYRARIREGRQTEERLKALAVDNLKNAKKKHDALEDYYKAHMDFSALSEYTDKYIEKEF